MQARYSHWVPTHHPIKRISSSEARANLAELLEQVGDCHERVLIERRGKPPVALISVDDLLRFQLLDELEARRGRHAPR